MSLSLSVNSKPDRNTLATSDMLFAVVLHLLVIIIAVAINSWQSAHEPEPMKRIEVRMISAAELKKMQTPPKPVTKPKPKPRVKPAAKPVMKPSQKAVAKPAEDENFDPFAPMASSTDRTEPTTQPASGGDLATIMGKQLSAQEIEVYIALMRQAVESRWKVPAGIDSDITDPVVEVVLRPGGSVVSVKILQSSGHAPLDRTLEAAIQAAAPFDFLPSNQFEAFRVNTITFRPIKDSQSFPDS